MKSADFLLEIGVEELPIESVRPMGILLEAAFKKALDEAMLRYENIRYFATPRRIAIYVSELIAEQPERMVEHRGPALTAAFNAQNEPTPALLGFAKKCGVAPEALTPDEKGERLVYRETQIGQATPALLPALIERTLSALSVPKTMRWGAETRPFIRPVHWITALWGNTPIAGTLWGVTFSSCTYGHRFHCPTEIQLNTPQDYEELLEKTGFVIPSFEKRKKRIEQELLSLAKQHQATLPEDDALLENITSLTEWPVAYVGKFDSAFLMLPEPVLIATLKNHQKMFHLRDKNGELLPLFLIVSNIESKNPDHVIKGNEQVVHARLSDAKFFYQADLKIPLEARLEALAKITYHQKLGSLGDRVKRIIPLAQLLAETLSLDRKMAERAATLCKCDLTTHLVLEFPELQGFAGGHYAGQEGEPTEVATAIGEYYRPVFAGDALPSTPLGSALAIADKLDMIVGFFSIQQKPTGEKDPFGLRRAALGILRIIIEGALQIDLKPFIVVAFKHVTQKTISEEQLNEILQFFYDRLKSFLSEQIRPDVFQAVLSLSLSHPYDIYKRLLALHQFVTKQEVVILSAAHKRVHNLLKQAQSEAISIPDQVDESILDLPAEKALFDYVKNTMPVVNQLVNSQDYTSALKTLSTLHQVVNVFFDSVMIMVPFDAIKKNRLALLQQLDTLLGGVADLSYLQITI